MDEIYFERNNRRNLFDVLDSMKKFILRWIE